MAGTPAPGNVVTHTCPVSIAVPSRAARPPLAVRPPPPSFESLPQPWSTAPINALVNMM